MNMHIAQQREWGGNAPGKSRGAACLKAVALGLALAAQTGIAASEETQFLNMATTSNASSHYPLAVAVGQSIEKGTEGRIRVNVLPGASAENLRRMKRDDVEVGLITMDTVYHAYHGVGSFDGEEPYEDLRLMFVYVATPILINVRADTGIEKFADLAGHTVNPGVPGSGAVAQVQRIAELLEVDVDWVEMALPDAVEETKNGRLAGFVKSAASPTSPDATFLDMSTAHEMRLIGIPPESAQMLEAEIPAFKTVQVPGGVYDGHPESLVFGGNMVGYAVDTDLSEDDVYAMTKAIFENRDLQNAAMSAISEVDYVDYTLRYATIPLHAGVVRYFEEMGHEVPDQLKADGS